MKKALAVALCSVPLALSSITFAHADGTGKTGGANASGTMSGTTDTNRNNNDHAHDGSSIDQTSPGNTYGATEGAKNNTPSTPRSPDRGAGTTEQPGTPSNPGRTYPNPATEGTQSTPPASPQGPAMENPTPTDPDQTYPDPKPGAQDGSMSTQ
ncbi:hypothetical protein C7440_2929 [Pusillimonas noertemannii]|uniref:Uncharacterized protein n=1 Tax=Pusillimonas noertemannii TaxID=305977 RepID=A0A2U1CK67_9BURK|nr:hypothetical protein C7440_2929 [Pusillimonas noertemannii]